MSDEKTQLMQALDQQLAVRDDEGRTVLQMALLATVYFEDPWRPEARAAVVSCCESYFRRCGPELRFAMNPDTDTMEPYGEGKGSNPRSWMLDLGEDQSFSVECHSAEYEEGAGAFSISALGMERRKYAHLGFLRVSFPVFWLAQRGGSLPEVLLDLCCTLRPVSGYGGIGVIDSPDSFTASACSPIVVGWSRRLPGLEVDTPAIHVNWLRKGRQGGKPGIKGVNWLTALGDRFVAEMGGADKIEGDLAALDGRFIVHRYDGGVVIQAGPRPELGDAQRDLWPELYVKLARYLEPIRITEHNPFSIGGPGERFDRARSEAWLRRFDDR